MNHQASSVAGRSTLRNAGAYPVCDSCTPRRPKAGRCILASVMLSLMLLGACATTSVLDESRQLVNQDRIEEALAKVEDAIRKDPGNVELRTFHARQRELGIARLLAQAEIARSVGGITEAEQALKRVLTIDPGNARAVAGLGFLQAERRHDQLVRDGEALLAKNDLIGAEAQMRAVLQENPNYRPALALQRRLAEKRAAGLAITPPALGPHFAKEISIEIRDAGLRSVFEIIARQHGVDFVFDRDVRQDTRVTIFVRHAAIEDVINLILATNQLDKKVLGANTLLIYPNTPAKSREYKDLIIRNFYLGNADAKQTLNMIRTLVKTRDVYVDEALNLLIMRDTPEAVRIAEKLIQAQDLAEPEVMLELEVLEVSRSRLSELGIRFPDQVNFGPLGISGGAPPASFAFSSSQLTATVANPAFIANLKLQDSQTNILANPRIRVKNRNKARVHVGERVPVITTTNTANVGVSASVSYLDVGLKLDVEPNVYLEDEIAIKVNLEVSNILETVDVLNTRAYRLGTRNATTTLRLRDGETQVLAGLISDDDRKTANKVPGLGELPVVGRLFGSHTTNDAKTEIVLLVTPRIIRNLVRSDTMASEYYSGTEAASGAAPLQIRGRQGSVSIRSSAPGSADAPAPFPPTPPANEPGPLYSPPRPGDDPRSSSQPMPQRFDDLKPPPSSIVLPDSFQAAPRPPIPPSPAGGNPRPQ